MGITLRLILVLAIAAFQATPTERRLIGKDIATVSARLKISPNKWNPSAEGERYEIACDSEHKLLLYGQTCSVCIVRKADKVAGLEFIAVNCDEKCYQQFRDHINKAYGLEQTSDSDIYQIERGGSVLRLTLEGDRTARLMVTDGEFGKAYAAHLLREGFRDLADKLRPH